MLKELKLHHREIIRLSFQGFKPVDIAARLDIANDTVNRILRDPLSKGYLAALEDKAEKNLLDVRQELMKLNTNAIDAITDILDKDSNAPHSVIFSAAKDVLDRNGYKAPKEIHLGIETKSDDEIDAQIAALEEQLNALTITSDEEKEDE